MDTRSLDHHGVPHAVLTGTDKRFAPVYALFRARMTQEWFRHLNVSYWTRAQGELDPVAGRWRKLAKRTLKRKRELEEEGVDTNFITPGQLPGAVISNVLAKSRYMETYRETLWQDTSGTAASQKHRATKAALAAYNETHKAKSLFGDELNSQKDFNERVKELLASDKSSASISTKRRKARQQALDEQGERHYATLINIRTGRLVSATFPGEVTNNRYYPTKDQTVSFRGPKIVISLRKVEYAGEVDAQREIIPRNTDVWYIESWNTVMPEVANLYREMKENNPALAKPKRRKKRGQGLEDAPF